MKAKTLHTTFILLMISNFYCFAQLPVIQWENTIGTSKEDLTGLGIPTSDGGYIVGASSEGGVSGDKTDPAFGALDYWVIKLDVSGNIVWQKVYGGSGQDYLSAIMQTQDGGFIIGGTSSSIISGNKTEPCYGSNDYWVIKIDSLGIIEWQKTLGGTSNDDLAVIKQLNDGNFLIAGSSYSPISGNKTEKSFVGGQDYWVVKLDTSGNILWQNDIGGTSSDNLYSAAATTDGGCILAGWSMSANTGDKNENTVGSGDFWIVKLNSAGNISWQNDIGGTGFDQAQGIIQTSDGGYLISGSSTSNISGDKTENGYGENDAWIIKLNPSGNIQWQKTLGGSWNDYGIALTEVSDGGYMIATESGSVISGNKTSAFLGGLCDIWMVRLSHTGNILWDAVVGGNYDDRLEAIIATPDGGYLISSYSNSEIGDQKSEDPIEDLILYGLIDIWMVKLAPENCTSEFCNGIDDDCNGVVDDGLSFSISISASGPTTFCNGETVLLNATGDGPNFKWKKNGTYIPGANSSTYTANKSGSYTCETFDYCTIVESSPIVVTVNKLPNATITAGGPTTFCAGGSVVLSANTGGGLTYQWYKGVNPQTGATMPNFTATLNGNYKCKVTKTATGCFKYSNVIAVSVPCKEGLPAGEAGEMIENEINIYPNPATKYITIETNNNEPKSVILYDALGKVVDDISTNENSIIIDVKNLPAGIYIVKIKNGNSIITQNFVKQ